MAAPLVLDSIGGLPAIQRWCVLVQREIAERLTAAPGDALYGAPSVLCALALEPTGRHAVSRSVFVPVPNVDSTLVAFARRAGVGGAGRHLAADRRDRARGLRVPPQDGRQRARAAGWRDDRAAVEVALRAAGIEPGARAESLPPEAFALLARAGGPA